VWMLCLLVGTAVLLAGLPGCFSPLRADVSSLHGRIELEQRAQLAFSFQQKRRIRAWEKNVHLLQRLCRGTGVDPKKTEEILSRLRWNITLSEVLLAKMAGGALLLVSFCYLLFRFYTGQEIRFQGLVPLLVALVVFLLPTILLDWADKRVKSEIREQVPIFFGIVQALVEAGMPVQSAVKNTARRFNGRLGWELARLEVEEKRFGTWRKALEEMAYRWEVDSLISIALEMNDAMTKGVSISGMLAVQVEEQLRQQEDESSAYMNRLQIRLLPFVILLMGVPLLFLVMGPAFMGMKEHL
jgi:tight adherence protein C